MAMSNNSAKVYMVGRPFCGNIFVLVSGSQQNLWLNPEAPVPLAAGAFLLRSITASLCQARKASI